MKDKSMTKRDLIQELALSWFNLADWISRKNSMKSQRTLSMLLIFA